MLDVKTNDDIQCYEITNEFGVNYYPYNVVEQRIKFLAKELNAEDRIVGTGYGTMSAYLLLRVLMQETMFKHSQDGHTSKVNLNEDLIGYEGQLVEVDYEDNTSETFTVGIKINTPFPVHMKIKDGDDLIGDPVSKKIKDFRVLY